MNENEAASTRFEGTVATWYRAHTESDPRDWNCIKEFHGPYHPLAGYYHSEDPAVLREQLRAMRRAGIDAIVYDCYGTATFDIVDMPNDRTLALLADELAHQEGESRQLQLIIWLEKFADNPSLEDYRFALRYVAEHFAEQPYYCRYRGRPLLVTYHNGPNLAIDEIEWENDYFTLPRIRPYHSDVWGYVEHYPQRLGREWMVASPGFDPWLEHAWTAKYYRPVPNPDYDQIRQNGRKHAADREGGEFFKKQLLRVRYGNPAIAFLSGWNDWMYACQIEPAVEYGFQYVDMAARLLGRQAETAPYRE